MDDQVQDQTPAADSVAEAPPIAKVNRRGFLKIGSVSSAAALLAACTPAPAPAPATAAPTVAPTDAAAGTAVPAAPVAQAVPAPIVSDLLPYPRLKLAALSDLSSGVINTTYPDVNSPVVVLKLGAKTVGGVGPDEDIVAYSGLCTHMGCPTSYDPATKIFACPCHFSHFDAAADAMLINGPATQHLPRLTLEVDGQDLYAVGVQGLIYGRPHNLSLTEL